MAPFFGKIIKSRLGGLPEEVAAFKQGKTKAEKHLGNIFLTVIKAFHTTLEDSRFEVLVPYLNSIEFEIRGFAYEGAGMGLVVLDNFMPWKKGLRTFLAGPGAPYVYPTVVGAGLALARLGKQHEQFVPSLDPLLGWLLLDGGGFRAGIFARKRYIEEKETPGHLSTYARRVFDQGMGRSIWFANGADIKRMAPIISGFSPARQADLWSGVGFACAYAGGADRMQIEAVRTTANAYRAQLALGAALGAKGRQRSGNLVPHTDLACEILCGVSGAMAAHMTDDALQNLPSNTVEPMFEIWRQRIEAHFVLQVESGRK